jgi:isocitrate dehydrogenase (NAD+)
VPDEGIDWTFFRENTEGEYTLGSKGIALDGLLAMDFKVTTVEGTRRIARAAYEFARKNGKTHVAIVTKSNIMKKTDGLFSAVCHEIAAEYPGITTDEYYIDIMTANLINPAIRKNFQVFLLPNLYGDIITDEAAQIQGGVGTAGSANVGDRCAMFEAIHGSAPRMVTEGRAQYADPCSMIKAVAMMLNHIGENEKGRKLGMALDICCQFEKKLVMTGRDTGATGDQFAQYVMETIQRPDLEKAWNSYIEASKSK